MASKHDVRSVTINSRGFPNAMETFSGCRNCSCSSCFPIGIVRLNHLTSSKVAFHCYCNGFDKGSHQRHACFLRPSFRERRHEDFTLELSGKAISFSYLLECLVVQVGKLQWQCTCIGLRLHVLDEIIKMRSHERGINAYCGHMIDGGGEVHAIAIKLQRV